MCDVYLRKVYFTPMTVLQLAHVYVPCTMYLIPMPPFVSLLPVYFTPMTMLQLAHVYLCTVYFTPVTVQ